MSGSFIIRCLCCIVCLGFLLFIAIGQQNRITRLRLQIPQLIKELRECEAENSQLAFEIACKEPPEQLMKWAEEPQFSHLKYPQEGEVISLK